MTPDSALEIVAAFMAVLLALALASVLLRPLWLPIWHLFRGTQEFLQDWNGEPERPGFKARPGAMARLAQLEANSGSTMRDAVDRIEKKVEKVVGDIEVVREDVGTVREAAKQATTAAGVAVGEAKAGRAVIAETAENSRRQIGELRDVVAGVVNAMELDNGERRQKEQAYVAALNQIGVPLLPIADELEGGHS